MYTCFIRGKYVHTSIQALNSLTCALFYTGDLSRQCLKCDDFVVSRLRKEVSELSGQLRCARETITALRKTRQAMAVLGIRRKKKRSDDDEDFDDDDDEDEDDDNDRLR